MTVGCLITSAAPLRLLLSISKYFALSDATTGLRALPFADWRVGRDRPHLEGSPTGGCWSELAAGDLAALVSERLLLRTAGPASSARATVMVIVLRIMPPSVYKPPNAQCPAGWFSSGAYACEKF